MHYSLQCGSGRGFNVYELTRRYSTKEALLPENYEMYTFPERDSKHHMVGSRDLQSAQSCIKEEKEAAQHVLTKNFPCVSVSFNRRLAGLG